MKSTLLLFQSLWSLLIIAQQAQPDWFNQDPKADNIQGIAVDAALIKFQSKNLAPVIVAVIDDGVDINHPDLMGKIWTNPAEIANNGKDDDANGYVDDVHGWNYLGNPDGQNVEHENLEITRMYRDLLQIYGSMDPKSVKGRSRRQYRKFLQLETEYKNAVDGIRQEFEQYAQLAAMYKGSFAYMQEKLKTQELSINSLFAFKPEDDKEAQIRDFLILAEQEGLKEYLNGSQEYYDEALNYHYNLEFFPRDSVNVAEAAAAGTTYGNNLVNAKSPDHGTHVAGIIAAVRGNDKGVDGIAPNAQIMALRAVPAGDERDEDVALAIRYAADNGAMVINMSFGKNYSPNTELVKDAIQYAASKDVLMVHAAGNDASDNDRIKNYPDGTLGKSRSMDNWIDVAANGVLKDSSWLANFSNYGRKSVDLMAPGVDITSITPEGKTATFSGTSMASPVVAGMSAVLRGAYPDLNATEIKSLIIESISIENNRIVSVAGRPKKMKKLLRNPGTPSLLNAMERAEAEK